MTGYTTLRPATAILGGFDLLRPLAGLSRLERVSVLLMPASAANECRRCLADPLALYRDKINKINDDADGPTKAFGDAMKDLANTLDAISRADPFDKLRKGAAGLGETGSTVMKLFAGLGDFDFDKIGKALPKDLGAGLGAIFAEGKEQFADRFGGGKGWKDFDPEAGAGAGWGGGKKDVEELRNVMMGFGVGIRNFAGALSGGATERMIANLNGAGELGDGAGELAAFGIL